MVMLAADASHPITGPDFIVMLPSIVAARASAPAVRLPVPPGRVVRPGVASVRGIGHF